MMTLPEVARMLGMTVNGQNVLRRVRKMEQATGRKILIELGEGAARRYLINPDEFASALHGEQAPAPMREFDAVAEQIADTVQGMDERHTRMSLELAETKRIVGELQAQLRAIRAALRAI